MEKFKIFEKEKIVSYITDKQLPDGGFFFAQVEPSSGFDTYCAVISLSLLGSEPLNKNAVLRFWDKNINKRGLGGIDGVYYAVKSLEILFPNAPLLDTVKSEFASNFEKNIEILLQKKKFDLEKDKVTFKNTNDTAVTVYTEAVIRELLLLYYFIILAKDFNLKLPVDKISYFLNSIQNEDGGYGSVSGSQIPTTCFAIIIASTLGITLANKEKIKNYINQKIKNIFYLEDLFFLSESTRILGGKDFEKEFVLDFVSNCQNDNGGFRRAREIGISTLENTYYAVKLLKNYKLV